MDIGSWITRDNANTAVAVAALLTAYGAWRAGHRSAKATEDSASAARDSAAEAKRSADAAEGATAAAVQGVQIAAASLALQQEAVKPRVRLTIKRDRPGLFLLRNEGDAPAVGLALHADDIPHVQAHDAWGESLPRNDSRELVLLEADRPASLRFTWEGQDDPVRVPVEV